jgi:hypothetical protein
MSVKIVTPLTPIHVVDGAAFASFTTFQDISPAPQLVIPQQWMEVGLDLDLEAWGEFSNTGTPTLAIGFWFNGAAGAAPTSILAQNALTTTVTGATSWPWRARYTGTLRESATGAAGGKWNGQGELAVGGSLTAWATGFPAPIPTTLALRTVTCDVTAARAVGAGAAWGTSSASNTIKVNGLRCLIRNGP